MQEQTIAYRQGDVMLLKVDSIPEGMNSVEEVDFVAAKGEVTGHHHIVKGESRLFFEGEYDFLKNPYIEVPQKTTLDHDDTINGGKGDHDSIEIPAGTYKVVQQRAYVQRSVRNVLD